jgi:small multidrug resistance pump
MVAAAVYNALWGLGVVLFAGPVAWKCVGMLVACYAPGYWLAAQRPLPEIVGIGLLGKILGPIGFVWAVATGRLPLQFGFVILANDVVWWPAFVAYLVSAYAGAPTGAGRSSSPRRAAATAADPGRGTNPSPSGARRR